MRKKKDSRLLTIIMAVLTAAIVLTGSIAVPILLRPFYYAHMEFLPICAKVGLTEEQVRETYNEIMDYCLGKSEVFDLTYLPWSFEGASHFTDVKMLFLLDIRIAAAAVIILTALMIIGHYKHIRPALIKGHTVGFWGAAGLGSVCIMLCLLAALDFDAAFTVFHSIFFPGKDNWIFDSAVDPVIDMLPQVFFRNCALLVAALIITCSILLIIIDMVRRKRRESI